MRVNEVIMVQEWTPTDIVRRDMKTLDDWSDKWLLTLNSNKCKTVHIAYGDQQADYNCVRHLNRKDFAGKEPGNIGVK